MSSLLFLEHIIEMGIDIVEKEFFACAGLPLNEKTWQSRHDLALLIALPIEHAVANGLHNGLDLVDQ